MKFLNAIILFFKKLFKPVPAPKPCPTPITTPDKKVAIIVGHNIRAQGATAINRSSEFEFNKYVANLTGLPTIFRNTEGYSSQCSHVAKQIRNGGFSHAICLHFNAYNSDAQGTEVLYTATRSKDFAEMALEKLISFGRLKNRGIKKATRGSQMLDAIEDAGAKAILLEPFFGDAPGAEVFLENKDNYAKILKDIATLAVDI